MQAVVAAGGDGFGFPGAHLGITPGAVRTLFESAVRMRGVTADDDDDDYLLPDTSVFKGRRRSPGGVGQHPPAATFQPVVQVMDVREISGAKGTAAEKKPARYRLVLSDGVCYIQAMLATQLNPSVENGTVRLTPCAATRALGHCAPRTPPGLQVHA